jgi:histidyl-tRNA synthetase
MLTEPPSGTRDFLPAEMRLRQRVFATIRETFERHGFEPMDTPAFERLETLMGKYGEEGEKLIFKILRRGERGAQGEADFALRYDLTVPLSRLFAHHRHALPRPFRRYQVGPVWRADRAGRGRYRELFQCDLDIVGAESILAEVEVIGTLAACYHAVGLPGVTFHVNSRKVLMAILEAYAVPSEQIGTATIALDKLDKLGAAGVAAELTERGLSQPVVAAIAADLASADLDSRARARAGASERGRAALAELDDLCGLLAPVLPESTTTRFAPFLARGLDYYTGCIFEVYHPRLPLAIGAGGRYDNLLSSFAAETIPACGGSFGVDRVLLLLQEQQQAATVGRSLVMVGVFSDDLRASALELARTLRSDGIPTELYCGAGQLGKQLKAAQGANVTCFVFQGPDETARGEAMVKVLATREQEAVPLGQLVSRLKTRLG